MHPANPDVYTLGECVTESYPSSYDGPDTVRSVVVLYYGSFLRIASMDADFNWDHEIWETITHEVQHHLEGLATEDDLEDFDYAVDQNYKRLNGDSFDPLFFRAGAAIGDGAYRVEEDVFLELPLRVNQPIEFTYEGERYRVAHSAAPADVIYLELADGPEVKGVFHVVLVAARSPLRQLGDALRRRPMKVTELAATATRVPQ